MVTTVLGNILSRITRATVLAICTELNIEVEERFFTIDELKQVDAAFFCGTAAEVIGFESLDDYKIPLNRNETVSRRIQLDYKSLVIEKEFEPQSTQR